MLRIVQHGSWQASCWIHATVSGVVQLVGLPVCSSSSTDMRPVLNKVCHWNTCVWLKLLSPKSCWIVVRVSIALFPRLAQNLIHTHCSFLWSIMESPQDTYKTRNKCVWKMPTSTQLHATWHNDSLDMAVPPSPNASPYHNCCIHCGTSMEYFGSYLG